MATSFVLSPSLPQAAIGSRKEIENTLAAPWRTEYAVAQPDNCAGVIAVAGLRHVGAKVGFSSLYPILTTTDSSISSSSEAPQCR